MGGAPVFPHSRRASVELWANWSLPSCAQGVPARSPSDLTAVHNDVNDALVRRWHVCHLPADNLEDEIGPSCLNLDTRD